MELLKVGKSLRKSRYHLYRSMHLSTRSAHPKLAPTVVRLTLEQQPRRKDREDEAEVNQQDKAEYLLAQSSRRKLADEWKWVTDDGVHVRPSRQGLHWTVAKMVDVADELIFRKIVSYL